MRSNSKAHWLLAEALRRYKRFHDGTPLTEAMTGLGSITEYAPAVKAGLMEPVCNPKPRITQWWKLTPAGAAIIQSWLDAGFNNEDIESGRLPPVPR